MTPELQKKDMSQVGIVEMTYYCLTALSPYGEGAGILCQMVADNIPTCGYPMCEEETVGAAVHEAIIKKDKKYIDGSKILPVCQKHKEWEFRKITPTEAWSLG